MDGKNYQLVAQLKSKEIKLKSSIGFRVMSYSFLVGSFIFII